jgi:hypothetical protein
MKIMARHSSATPREEKSTTPDGTPTRREETSNLREKESDNLKSPEGETGGRGDGETRCSTLKSHIIDASLKRRARLLITNSSIPRQTRSLIRYALEIKDPYLAQVVRRVEAGEITIDCLHLENSE